MQLIGFLNNKNLIFNTKLFGNEFRSIIKDKEFNLYCDSTGSKEKLLYHSRKDIHLVLFGYVTSESHYSTENPRDTLDAIIENYLVNGIKSFNSLDGSYIVILWDAHKNIIYIGRDIYGTKLLYFYFSPRSGFAFSNNLDILLRATGQRNISHKALHEYLRFLDISPPYTIYENTYFLEPDKILISDGRQITQQKISTQTINEIQRDELLEDKAHNFKNILYQSIKKRIEKAQRVGVFLSGGIDSTLVCAIAARIKKDIKAYTVGFGDPRYDESKIARNITSYLGIEHQVFKFTIEEDYNVFNEFVTRISSPFADPAVIPTFQCFKHIANSVDIVLDGTGADSLIGIMPARHIRFILQYARYIPYEIRLFISNQLNKLHSISSYSSLFDFKKVVELLIRWQGWSEEEISLLCNVKCDLSYTRFYRLFAEHSHKEPYELYSILIGALADDRQLQTAPLYDIDIAFPFWDRKVQEYVKNLPLKYKYHDGTSKILFRKLLEELIPTNIWDKPKHPFDYPFKNLLIYSDYKLPKLFLSRDVIKKQGFFDSFIVEKYLKKFLDGDDSIKFKIWALVVFQAWYFNHYQTY